MKTLIHKSILSVLALSFLVLAPAFGFAKTYELSNGESFDGSEKEYKYAQLMLDIEEDLPSILEKTWNKTVKKYKFPSIDKLASSATFKGDSGYNKDTKEFYVSNVNGSGEVILEMKHSYTRKETDKLINSFVKELEKSLEKIQKDKKVSDVKIKKGTDLEAVYDSFEDSFVNIGIDLGLTLQTVSLDYVGKTNKTNPQPILVRSSSGKKVSLSDYEYAETDYYKVPTIFDEEVYFEDAKGYYKNINVYFMVDVLAEPGTTVNFKILDLRAFSKLKARDIWVGLY